MDERDLAKEGRRRSGKARPRFKTPSQIDAERREADEEGKAAKRRTERRRRQHTGHAGLVRTRLAEVIDELGGASAAEAKTGVDRSTIAGWLRENDPTTPDFSQITRIALGSGVSVDWLLAFDGAPKLRRDRQLVTDLEAQLAAHVAQELASTLDTTVDFVRAALPPSPEILKNAVEQQQPEVHLLLQAKRADEIRIEDRVCQAIGLKAIGPDVLAILRELDESPEDREREARVRALPPTRRISEPAMAWQDPTAH